MCKFVQWKNKTKITLYKNYLCIHWMSQNILNAPQKSLWQSVCKLVRTILAEFEWSLSEVKAKEVFRLPLI